MHRFGNCICDELAVEEKICRLQAVSIEEKRAIEDVLVIIEEAFSKTGKANVIDMKHAMTKLHMQAWMEKDENTKAIFVKAITIVGEAAGA